MRADPLSGLVPTLAIYIVLNVALINSKVTLERFPHAG